MNCSLVLEMSLLLGVTLLSASCERKVRAQDRAQGKVAEGIGPVATTVLTDKLSDMGANDFAVPNPDRFALSAAEEHDAAPEMNVTGVVSPDVSRQIPVPSLATGRIVEVFARLGDPVKKGQLLFRVRSTDVSSAFSDYRKAVKNEELARVQLERAKLLFENGAIPRSALEVAQNAEELALVDLDTSAEHLKLLGSELTRPTGIIDVTAPVSGVITDQQITGSAGVQALSLPAPFTISDISHVWVLCDVYENQMANVRMGEFADIHLVAYPDRVLRARISNILPTIDPNIRTAKVRLEVENPGLMRLGMFVTATFHGAAMEKRAAVPATSILHLHDREWVYTPLGNGHFRRTEVVAGNMLPNKMQEVISGLKPGDRVLSNALVFQNTVEQ